MNLKKYLKGRINSFGFAFIGFKLLMKEANFQIHIFVFALVIILSFYFSISSQEWFFVVFSSVFVLVCEAINTAIEKMMDFVSKERDDKIANIKDISAAFVFISAMNAVIVGGIIFIPKLLELLE